MQNINGRPVVVANTFARWWQNKNREEKSNPPPGLNLDCGSESIAAVKRTRSLVLLFLSCLFLSGLFSLCWHRLSPLSIRNRGGSVKDLQWLHLHESFIRAF